MLVGLHSLVNISVFNGLPSHIVSHSIRLSTPRGLHCPSAGNANSFGGMYRMCNVSRNCKRVSDLGTPWRRRLLLALLFTLLSVPGFAASSKGCSGGGFSLLGLSGDQKTIVLASKV